MKVIVTGCAGHLGSHVVPELLQEGFEVTGIDMCHPATALPGDYHFICLDLVEQAKLVEALAGASVIVHCASIHPWKKYSDEQYLDCNIKGTWSLYNAAVTRGIDRIVLTSSIAAIGYTNVPADAWPVTEELQFPLGDLYSFTKHAQEEIACLFAAKGQVQTIALRPPAFMPKSELETGFSLTGVYALVSDVALAHVAAVRVLTHRQKSPEPLGAVEAFFITNFLPYTREDATLMENGSNVRPLVKKYWPEAYQWLTERGYQGAWLPAVYNLSKAKRLLHWEPKCNFEEWFAKQQIRGGT